MLIACRRRRQYLHHDETNCICAWDRSAGKCFADDCQLRNCGFKTGSDCRFDGWVGTRIFKKEKAAILRKDYQRPFNSLLLFWIQPEKYQTPKRPFLPLRKPHTSTSYTSFTSPIQLYPIPIWENRCCYSFCPLPSLLVL